MRIDNTIGTTSHASHTQNGTAKGNRESGQHRRPGSRLSGLSHVLDFTVITLVGFGTAIAAIENIAGSVPH